MFEFADSKFRKKCFNKSVGKGVICDQSTNWPISQSITNHRLPWQLFTQYSLDSNWLALLLDFVMADRMLLRAIKGQAKNLNLGNKGLETLPALIGKVTSLQILTLKGNKLQDLPRELVVLRQLESLHLGNNNIKDIPAVIGYLVSLKTLHLFNNQIKQITPTIFSGLSSLTLLNLNNNQISELPREINRLSSLEYLSIDNNELNELPVEICHLSRLVELHAANNHLKWLPSAIAFLRDLQKLYLQKNEIDIVPVGLSKCTKLRVLDISANRLCFFPSELAGLSLDELYCEQNNLLQHLPVQSLQDEEILPLKELAARFILMELRDTSSYMRIEVKYNKTAQEILAGASECVVCGEPFLNTWLECVRFVDAKKILGAKNNCGIIPLRGMICSYKCFNTEGHDFYGIAQIDCNEDV
eukprot:Seg3528.1 transcript_id=Seg3528.1/GoldUCD/mRNA.D3Y31 product="Leucine-rich repeat-containing protein 69" protein_id=Seg3528.1/GoldUCD/D3Y31